LKDTYLLLEFLNLEGTWNDTYPLETIWECSQLQFQWRVMGCLRAQML